MRLEETHRRDIQEVREEVSTLTDHVASREESVSSLAERVAALKQSQDQHREAAIALQLHLEDVEDRSRCNNLRLRGIPEPADAEDVGAKVIGIFCDVLGDPGRRSSWTGRTGRLGLSRQIRTDHVMWFVAFTARGKRKPSCARPGTRERLK